MGAFDRLIEQIDAFIRKYYKNQMIRGLIWFLGVFLLSYLLVATLEYFGRFNSGVRGFLFFSFIGINLFILGKYIVVPLLKLNSFGKRINRYQASDIIGQFFPNVSDRLKNTLQLNDSLGSQEGNLELLRASVAQRSETLVAVPFVKAVDISENRKYLKYILPILLFFLGVLVFVPALLKQGTERVVNYTEEFPLIAPFTFQLNNFNSEAIEGEDIPIELELVGTELPDRVYIVSQEGKYLLKKEQTNVFSGRIKRVKSSGSFHFLANEYSSEDYHYEVKGKATIGVFDAILEYPAYLGRPNETVKNSGDLTIPEGTKVSLSVVTKNMRELHIQGEGVNETFTTSGFKWTSTFKDSKELKLHTVGTSDNDTNTIHYSVNVIKDAYPTILVTEEVDSLKSGVRYFDGSISDDYGLNSLVFMYEVRSKNGEVRKERLSVQKTSGQKQPFNFAVDFNKENLKLNDKVNYYFVVTDNDGVNGNKSSSSQRMTYVLPSLDSLNEKRDQDLENAQNTLNNLLKDAQKLREDVKEVKKDLINSKSVDWNKKNQVQQLQEEQKSLMQQLEQLQLTMEESIEEKTQLSEMDDELLEKQEMIEDLLEELMDDEMLKLLEELEKLMEEQNKDKLQEKLEDIEMSSEDMNNQLDRTLEMLKKQQVDEKIDAIEEELDELAKEQEELKEQIDKEQLSEEEAKEKQSFIDEKFEEIKEDIEEMNKLNEALERPMEMGSTEDKEKEISEELKEAQDKLDKGKEKKAGENQQNAADGMKELSEQLDMMQQQSNQQQQSEDMDLLREILESLVVLSEDQEWVMDRLYETNELDPAFRSYGRFQRKIIDNTVPVRDSLLSLAKRQPKIASFIDKELHAISSNQRLSLEDIDERRKRELGVHQQYSMTSYNNLALLLNESLQQMQQQMQQMMKQQGSGSCNNPGGQGMPKPGNSMSPGSMKEMLKKQLEDMQKGSNPGGNKPGEKPGQKPGEGGSGGMMGLSNKQVAKMAAEQGAIRRRLEQLRNELNKEGKGQGNQLNPLIEELEKQEQDLINKNFRPEMIKRQKEILTRLLDSEKALMERGFEEKRESKSGKNQENGNQIRFDEYNKAKLNQIELLRSIDPVYNQYYKNKANQLFNEGF